jgi:hypothetical protein
LPIVALPGGDSDESSYGIAGMNECLTKPVSLDALGATLHRWLADSSSILAGENAARASAAAAGRASVIDRKALDQIRALQRPGAANLVAPIVQSYLAHAAVSMENLAATVRAGNY